MRVDGTRRLTPDDAEALVALRREALLAEPFAFAASPADDRGGVPELVRAMLADADERAVFGHFVAETLVGMVGIGRESKVKQRHCATVWGMYVSPTERGRGVGRALLDAAVEQARRWDGVELVHLAVAVNAAAAARLYARAGFRVWGREPRALRWEGTDVDEDHMVLDLVATRAPDRR